MKIQHVSAAMAAVVAAAAAQAQLPDPSQDTPWTIKQSEEKSTDRFVQNAASENMFAIGSSNLAIERTQSPEIRDFAHRMVEAHTKLGTDLQAALASSHASASAPQQLDVDALQKLEDLRTAPSDAFDREYVRVQTKMHEEAVSLFSQYAQNGDDREMRRFAQDALPTLQSHLEAARRLSETAGLG